MSERLPVVVLLSGGMDSVTAFYEALDKHHVVGALSFDYGSKHNHKEIPFAQLHCERHGVPHHTIRLDFMDRLFESDLLQSGGEIPEGHYAADNMKSTVVPFRNGIMLSIAAGYAESVKAKGVVIAAHSGDHAIYPDCREDFMRSMHDAMRHGTYAQVNLLRPFIDLDKGGICRVGLAHGIDYAETWSCYKGRERHCGVCGTCYERKEAFEQVGAPDPTEYEPNPDGTI